MTQSTLGKLVARLVAAFAILMMVAAYPGAAFAEDPSENELSDMTGDVQTGIQMQNVGNDTAEVSVMLKEIDGSGEYTLPTQNIDGGAALNYFMPNFTDVPGGAYSLIATADQPLEAMVQTVYTGSSAVGNYTSVAPGKDVILPYVTRDWANQSSQITVQNASQSTDTTFTIEVIGIDNSGSESATETLGPGKAVTYDVKEAPFSNLANNGEPYGIPGGFLGYAQVTVTSGDSVVVQSFIDIAGQGVMSAFTGVPADSSSTTLYAPLLRRNFAGDTGMQFVNTNATDASITVTYYTDGTLLDQEGSTWEETYTQADTVPAGSSKAIFLATDGTMPQGDRPDGSVAYGFSGWFGVAMIESDQPLFGVINDSTFDPATFSPLTQATNNMATADDAGTSFALPLVRKNFPNFNNTTTGVQIMNTSSSAAQVNINYTITRYDAEGNVTGNDVVAGDGVSIVANGSGNIYQGAFTGGGVSWEGLGDWVGSAVVTSDQPIVLIVNDSTEDPNTATTPLDSGNYGGLQLGQ